MSIRILSHLRDFLTEEQVKWLSGNIQIENCILLTQHQTLPIPTEDVARGVNVGNHKTVVQVFDSKGIWIGEISNPDFIPKN